MDFPLGNHTEQNPKATSQPPHEAEAQRGTHSCWHLWGEQKQKLSDERSREEGGRYLLRAQGPQLMTKAKATGLNCGFHATFFITDPCDVASVEHVWRCFRSI